MEDTPTYGTQDFKAIAKQIKDCLELEVDNNNGQELTEKIKQLSMLTGSAAALQANAKKMLLQKELELLRKYKNSDLQPSVLMRMISAEAYEESGWVTYAERLNAGISHSLDALRSSLSYLKTELENLKHTT